MNPPGDGAPAASAPAASAPAASAPAASAPAPATRTRPLVGLLAVLIAAVAGGFPSFSVGANLLVLGAGAALFWAGLTGFWAGLTGAGSTGAGSTGAGPTGAGSTGAESTGAGSTGAASTGAGSTGMSGRRPTTRLPRSARWWLVPFLGLIVVEATSFALGSTYDHPTLSGLADPLLDRYPARAGAFLAWTAAFWALARR
jgi:hypothetical protein